MFTLFCPSGLTSPSNRTHYINLFFLQNWLLITFTYLGNFLFEPLLPTKSPTNPLSVPNFYTASQGIQVTKVQLFVDHHTYWYPPSPWNTFMRAYFRNRTWMININSMIFGSNFNSGPLVIENFRREDSLKHFSTKNRTWNLKLIFLNFNA